MSKNQRTVITVSLNSNEVEDYTFLRDELLKKFPESYQENLSNSQIMKLIISELKKSLEKQSV